MDENIKKELEGKLRGGKAFSLGRTVEVVKDVLHRPSLLSAYFELFGSQDPQVVMRASNGLKRIYAEQPQWFEKQKSKVITTLKNCSHDSARWTLIQLLKKYMNNLDSEELELSFNIARGFVLDSNEWITLTQSMGLIINLKGAHSIDAKLKNRVIELSGDQRKSVANKAKKMAEMYQWV